eukprot:gene7397-8217_t
MVFIHYIVSGDLQLASLRERENKRKEKPPKIKVVWLHQPETESAVMMEALSIVILICIIAILVVSLFGIILNRSSAGKWSNLPPSPPVFPMIGNLLDMKGDPHKVFIELGKKYGSIFTFWFGRSKPVIIINDQKVAREAFIHGAHALSGRPQRYTGSIYTKNFSGIVLKDDNKQWQTLRRLGHQALMHLGEEKTFSEAVIQEECMALINRINRRIRAKNPLDISKDLELSSLNVICALMFGSRYEENDPEFLRISQANSWFVEGIQSGNMVDGFPLLRYLPYRPLRLLRDFVKVRDEILQRKLKEHEQTFVAGNTRDFTDALIEAVQDQSWTDAKLGRDNKLGLMADLFLTGTETTATALKWAIMYLAQLPDKQQKAFEQLKAFSSGSGDFPKYKDKPSLPYIEAMMAEVLRMASLAPLAVPHKATCDTKINDYDVPKGTVLLMNIYAMHHDTKYWQDPEKFEPERFLHEDGHFCIPNSSYLPFSLGKRVCLGETLAKREMFLILCYLLKTFKFEKAEKFDFSGKFGATLTPKPYKVKIVKR